MIHSKRNHSQPKILPLWHPTGLFNKPCQNKIITSAVRYSKIAALYTAAVAPTRPWLVVRVFRCLWIRPTGNWIIKTNQTLNITGLNATAVHFFLSGRLRGICTCRPALCDLETAFVLAFPLSFPAFPPACRSTRKGLLFKSLIEGEKTIRNLWWKLYTEENSGGASFTLYYFTNNYKEISLL